MRTLRADGSHAALTAARAASAETGRAWRDGAACRALARVFADGPPGDAEAAAARAEALLADIGWAEAMLAPLVDALRADPWFEPPLRCHRDPLRTGALLFDCPAASVHAVVSDAAALAAGPPPRTMVVPGRISVTRYVHAGGALLRRWHAPRLPDPGPCVELAPLAPRDGAVIRCDGRREAQLLAAAGRDVVALTVTILAGADPLLREYRIADGALVRTGSTDDRASRAELLLTFLRHAGHGTGFAAASRDPAHQLRWAAMREWLLCDAAAALPRLGEMARSDPHPEVRAAAAATRARIGIACRA